MGQDIVSSSPGEACMSGALSYGDYFRRLFEDDAVQQLIFFRALVEERRYRLSPVRKKQIVIPTVYPRASEGRSEGILRFVVKSLVSKTLSQALFL
jgi:hypothetical protein